MTTKTKKNAFDKATDKARGIVDESGETVNPDIGALVSQQQGVGDLTIATPESIAALMSSGEFETGERILEFKQGVMYRGQLIGRGGDVEIVDDRARPPTTKKVGSWRMRLDSGIRVTFLTGAQLERVLPEFIGRKGATVIVKGDRIETRKGNQMDEFLVLGPKPNAPRFPIELREGRHFEIGETTEPASEPGK